MPEKLLAAPALPAPATAAVARPAGVMETPAPVRVWMTPAIAASEATAKR